MTLFAIRDDDTCYFTQPDELERVYSPIWGQVPVCLSVIPFAVPIHKGVPVFGQMHTVNEPIPLAENQGLVNYLKEQLSQRKIEIMLHGFNHIYKKINEQWVGEYGWKDENQLMEQTAKGKHYLEETFNISSLKVFVPPSNMIGKKGIRAIAAQSLHLSGVMGRWGDRPISFPYLKAYAKRRAHRLFYGRPYPFPLDLRTHRELVMYTLSPQVTFDSLKRAFDFCTNRRAPFVLATHYWENIKHPAMLQTMHRMVDYVLKRGAQPATVLNCMGT